MNKLALILLAIALTFAVVGAIKVLVAAVAISLMIAFAVLALISYALGAFVNTPCDRT